MPGARSASVLPAQLVQSDHVPGGHSKSWILLSPAPRGSPGCQDTLCRRLRAAAPTGQWASPQVLTSIPSAGQIMCPLGHEPQGVECPGRTQSLATDTLGTSWWPHAPCPGLASRVDAPWPWHRQGGQRCSKIPVFCSGPLASAHPLLQSPSTSPKISPFTQTQLPSPARG